MSADLFDKLTEYSKSDIYSFAMPGHKRLLFNDILSPYLIDITEIEGFDNLHDPSGVLKDIEDKAAALCGSRHAFISVNGSTAGILAALFSFPCESDILVGRNCHKSVYDGCFLNRMNITVIEPEWVPELGVYGGLKPGAIEKMLKERKFDCVVITSPTYEGFVSDIEKIAEIAHRHGALLIVDSAHGAHFHFHEAFPTPAISNGADIVIESLHKTLPSLNQTALVLVNNDELARKVGRRIDALLTTSPSYCLMAGIDRCLTYAGSGRFDFCGYVKRLKDLRHQLTDLSKIKIAGEDLIGKYGISDIDISKIVFYSAESAVFGRDIYEYMLKKHRLQFESLAPRLALAMTSVADSEEGFSKLRTAAEQFDLLSGKDIESRRLKSDNLKNSRTEEIISRINKINTGCPYENFIYLYPPGSPVIIPGEIFTEEIKENIITAARLGQNILIKEKI